MTAPIGTGCMWLSAMLAALPIITVFFMLGVLKFASHKSAIAGTILAASLAVVVWQFPILNTCAAGLYGIATGLFPIIFIIATSLLLYNLTVVSGWADKLQATLARTISDQHLLLLLIGFGFAAFLDSTAGFLTPVTVATVMLIGLGVPAFEAGSYALVASSLPPIFGAMGIPVVVMAEVTGIPLYDLAAKQAVIASILFFLFPLWLTAIFGGLTALRRLWLHSLASGIAYGVVLWITVTYISLFPAALFASMASLLAIISVIALKADRSDTSNIYDFKTNLKPWWPYGMLTVLVMFWSYPSVYQWLNRFSISIPVTILSDTLQWRFNFLASAGTAIFLTSIIFAAGTGLSYSQLNRAAIMTWQQIRLPVVNIMAMLALAQIMNFSGMTLSLSSAVANTGTLFPFLGPYLSWIGAAITGSNTASNAILGQLQATTAMHLDLSSLKLAALAGVVAPLGKMVAPQILAAVTGVGHIAGHEGRLLRIGLSHSLVWVTLVATVGYVWVSK